MSVLLSEEIWISVYFPNFGTQMEEESTEWTCSVLLVQLLWLTVSGPAPVPGLSPLWVLLLFHLILRHFIITKIVHYQQSGAAKLQLQIVFQVPEAGSAQNIDGVWFEVFYSNNLHSTGIIFYFHAVFFCFVFPNLTSFLGHQPVLYLS